MKGWKNLPTTLVAMFVIDIVSAITFVTYDASHSATDNNVRMMLASNAISLVTCVLGVSGFFELAGRTSGRVAAGFRITAFGFALSLGLAVWWHIFQILNPHWSFETTVAVEKWTHFGVTLLPLLGIIIAASVAHTRAAIAAAVVLMVTDPVPVLAQHVYASIAHGWKAQMVIFELLHIAALVTTLAIAARIATAGSPPQTRDGAYGLQTISFGLWLRVIAACGVAALTLMFALGRPGEGAVSVLRLATFASAVVGVISLAMIARGALAARVADMPGGLLVAAACGALWCLGVTLAQLPYTYHMLYGTPEDYGYGSMNRDFADALSIVAPIVAICAVAVVARAIAEFAVRRGLEQLRVEALNKGAGFVTLMLASLACQQWLLPKAESESSVMFLLVAAAACSLWATVLMARLCTLAADSLAVEPGLPTATLRS